MSKTDFQKREEISGLIHSGRSELVPEKCKSYLANAILLSKNWLAERGGTIPCKLAAESIRELIFFEQNPIKRAQLWKEALKLLRTTEKTEYAYHIAFYLEFSVDVVQDVLSSISSAEKQKILVEAKKIVDSEIIKSSNPEDSAIYLARKSSILRHQALECSSEIRYHLLSESQRCASLAVEKCRNDFSVLELAMSEWFLSRYQKTEDQYISKLNIAEDLFKSLDRESFEPAQLALSSFYRLTYRPLDACETFPHFAIYTHNKRRLLCNAPIYGESAVNLVSPDYPEQVSKLHLQKAAEILEIAIASGYRHARVIIALAFCRAILEGTSAGLTALQELNVNKGEIDWNNAIRTLRDAKESDLPSLGFALGISDSSALTRLGTFANRFLQNSEISEALYRAAVKNNPQDHVALTNLARILVRKGSSSSFNEAKRLLQQAQTFSDRRFRWWRNVLADIDEIEKTAIEQKVIHQQKKLDDVPDVKEYHSLKQIRQQYRRISRLDDKQKRGYELEKLIFALADITLGIAKSSYRYFRPLVEKIHQVDNYFEHRGEKYRCECKWLSAPVGYNDIILFLDKLDVVGVSGFFVSISGFDSSAIRKCKEIRGEKAIILSDGKEIDLIMKGALSFDEVLTVKRLQFNYKSDPYYKIKALIDEAEMASQ